MSHFEEKVFFGIFSMMSSGFLWLGAIMTEGDARWLYITFASSIMTAAFLSLVFKKTSESIRLVVGRSGLAIMGGIFGTKFVVSHTEAINVYNDGIALAGVACGVCIASFLVGFTLLGIISKKSEEISQKILDKYLNK